MTIFLCSICFSIYAKMQGFVDECANFFLFFCILCTVSEINVFFCVLPEIQDGHQNGRNTIIEKSRQLNQNIP